jgi:hypothetical protein
MDTWRLLDMNMDTWRLLDMDAWNTWRLLVMDNFFFIISAHIGNHIGNRYVFQLYLPIFVSTKIFVSATIFIKLVVFFLILHILDSSNSLFSRDTPNAGRPDGSFMPWS